LQESKTIIDESDVQDERVITYNSRQDLISDTAGIVTE
jgi:hypothetical protein